MGCVHTYAHMCKTYTDTRTHTYALALASFSLLLYLLLLLCSSCLLFLVHLSVSLCTRQRHTHTHTNKLLAHTPAHLRSMLCPLYRCVITSACAVLYAARTHVLPSFSSYMRTHACVCVCVRAQRRAAHTYLCIFINVCTYVVSSAQRACPTAAASQSAPPVAPAGVAARRGGTSSPSAASRRPRASWTTGWR